MPPQKRSASFIDNNGNEEKNELQSVAPPASRQKTVVWPFVLLFVILVIGGALYLWMRGGVSFGREASRGGYQAVFLTNGQVYFGKVLEPKKQFVTVTNIFYLQQRQKLQEPGATGDEKEAQKAPEPELALVKLGEELHGPKDRMEINRNHILFIEDLKEDGKVVQAIQQYQEKNP